LPALDVAEVFVTFALLPESCQPLVVTREQGVTLLTLHATATKWQATAACVDRLTEAEAAAIRLAYGVSPVGTPCPDHWVADEPVDLSDVPPELRLPTDMDRRLPHMRESA
jgi:hypothetical protein